jgi:hypothetical protein
VVSGVEPRQTNHTKKAVSGAYRLPEVFFTIHLVSLVYSVAGLSRVFSMRFA